jgi:hypothetical protein
MSDSARRKRAAAMAAMALALAGCEAVNPPPADPGLCPKIYQPVCARTGGGQTRTFPNACTAEASGFRAYSPGACQQSAPDRVCPQVYLPVCARIGGQLATYPNDCIAGAQGAQVVRKGPC